MSAGLDAAKSARGARLKSAEDGGDLDREAARTRVSCPGLKTSPHTSRQPSYEGDACLKLHAALAARAGFPERAWEVCTGTEASERAVFCFLRVLRNRL